MMEYTPTSIAWSVNGKLYAQFTKGSGDQLWPWQSAMDISFSIWEDPAKAGWMGTYAYNPESLASMTITDFQYKGCAVTSGGDTDAGSPDDSEGDTEDGPGEVGGGDGSGSNPGPTSTGGDTPGNSEASGVSGGNSTSESGGNASGSNMSGSDGGPKTSIVWVDPTDSSSAGDDKDEPETTTLESTEETEETEEPVPTTSDDTEDDVDDSIDDGSQDVDNGAIRLSTAFSLAVATFISLRLVDVHA